jgi:hypothetical protein
VGIEAESVYLYMLFDYYGGDGEVERMCLYVPSDYYGEDMRSKAYTSTCFSTTMVRVEGSKHIPLHAFPGWYILYVYLHIPSD